ncbi:TetR/AcrR family transcriptional regulator [Actinokineospora sp. NBRC 105648]|uniref:TetR/AcrR family transcriptional regulator n=1 Tax=Actinokineospora sp. NBRC 105648 TaxID=3032206 RepID=UPI00255507A0|nr:TetR/AcrR family transcriptional regulator [Actinokineospora sp. NBRC 105648]
MGSRRGRDDWTAIALVALAEGGLAAVAVEPLAARAGATKGSLYWHFPTRDALVEATLLRWEREHAGAVIEFAERGADPGERLRLLFEAVWRPESAPEVELALLASAGEPLVAAVLARVGERRVDYLAAQYGLLGFTRAQSRRRALTAYSIYLGQGQLHRAAPELVPRSAAARRAHVADVLRVLLVDPVEH